MSKTQENAAAKAAADKKASEDKVAVARAEFEASEKAFEDAKQKTEAAKKALDAVLEAEKVDSRPTFKRKDGAEFAFKTSTPKTIRIDGKVKKCADLIKNKAVMLELVSGNSSFVERVK